MEANTNNPIWAIAENQWEIIEKEMVNKSSLNAKFIGAIRAVYMKAYCHGFETAYEGTVELLNKQLGE